MKRLRQIMLYVSVAGCIAVVLLQALAFASGWNIGVRHLTRHQIKRLDVSTDRGVFFDGGLRLFSDRGGHATDGSMGWVGGDLDYDFWESMDSAPAFSVSSSGPPSFTNSNWTVLGTGYRRSVAKAPGMTGEFHLIVVHPLVILLACAAVVAFAARHAVIAHRVARRARKGQCLQCGYDLRGGHDRCPECGAPMALSFTGDPTTVTAHAESD